MRAIAGHFRLEGIRVNALGRGTVRKHLLDTQCRSGILRKLFTSMGNAAKYVYRLIGGNGMTESKGNTVPGAKVYGQALEINLEKFYFRS